MGEDTWTTVAMPILEAVASMEQDGVHRTTSLDLAETLGVPERAAELELRRLHEDGYVVGKLVGTWGGPVVLTKPRLGSKGARAVGSWPDPYDALIGLIDARIAAATTEEERTRWQRFRSASADVGKGGLGGLLVELGKAAGGLA